ncbi:MAG: hypothetical protein AAGN35_26935 [Bacteroidota bacterium]
MSSAPSPNRALRRWWPIPVGLLLGLAFGWWWFRPPAPTPDELFAQYFIPHHLPVLYVDGGKLENWNAAAEAYRVADFAGASRALARAEQAEEISSAAIHFYRGQCALAQGDAVQARAHFQEVFALPEGPHAAARWYNALALLKLHQIAPCQDALREIISDKGYKAATAQQLLEDFQ